MSSSALFRRLDELLGAVGFERKGQTWNRASGTFIDVIDVQLSKAADTMTVNTGVLDPEIHRMAWGTDPDAFVEEPDCTVRSRIGYLMGNKDVWWSRSDQSSPDGIIESVESYVLPFLTRMHSPGTMEEYLVELDVVRKKYPPPIIFLAVMRHTRGDGAGACALLKELHAATSRPWQTRIRGVSERLGCR